MVKRKPTPYKYIGTLPAGDWHFGLLQLESRPDVIIMTDMTGGEAPRMLIEGKLVEVAV